MKVWCVLVALFAVSFVQAALCDDVLSSCYGASIESRFGFGGVELCNDCYRCGELDSVCPEDFSDGTQFTNCSRCADPDCVVSLEGLITSEDLAVMGATVEAVLSHQTITYETITDHNGHYALNVPRGLYPIRVSKAGYATRIINFPYDDEPDSFTLNVDLTTDICHNDCTGTHYEYDVPRCSAACWNFGSCEFKTYEDDFVDFPGSYDAADICDTVPAGMTKVVDVKGDKSLVIDCCMGNFYVVSRPAAIVAQTVTIPNLITRTLVVQSSAHYGPVKLKLLIYNKE